MFLNKAGINFSQLRKYLNGNIDVPLIPKANNAQDLGSAAFAFRDGNFSRIVNAPGFSRNALHNRSAYTEHFNVASGNLQPVFSCICASGNGEATGIRVHLFIRVSNIQVNYVFANLTGDWFAVDSAGSDLSTWFTTSFSKFTINSSVLDMTIVSNQTKTAGVERLGFTITATGSAASGALFDIFAYAESIGQQGASLAGI